jgi:GPH family glycoside/pentoside/hexuronide:cation symporter
VEFLKRKKGTSALGYACAIFGITLITQLFQGYNFSYYNNDEAMVDMNWATAAKIIFVIVDWLNDIVFGTWSERTKNTKYGKRIPWIVGDLLVLPIFVIATFAVSHSTGWGLAGFAAYYIIISISFENSSTVMYVNYNATFPTLFHSTNSRSKCATYKHLFEFLAMAVCYSVTPILTGECHIPYWIVGCIYAGAYLVSMIVFFFTTNIEDDVKTIAQDEVKYSFKDTIKDCLKDKSFIVYNVAMSFFTAIMSIAVTMYPMYCQYVLGYQIGGGGGYLQSLVFICFFASVIISIPIWYIFIRKIGFIRVWLICFTALPFALLLLLIPSPANGSYMGPITWTLCGPFIGGLMLTPDMLFAELVDIDRLKHHTAREAALGSVGTLIGRISVIISVVISALITYAFQYQSGTQPGPNPELAFRVTFGAFLPLIAACGTFFAYFYIRISRKDRMVLHELKRKDAEDTTELNINEVINETR